MISADSHDDRNIVESLCSRAHLGEDTVAELLDVVGPPQYRVP